MAAECDMIARINGRDSFAYGSGGPAWHRKGQEISPTAAKSVVAFAAGMNFTMRKQGLWVAYDPALDLGRGGRLRDLMALTRTDTGDVFAAVSRKYQEIQPDDILEICDGLVQNGLATWSAAGVLDRGERMWACLQVAAGNVTADDVVRKHLLVYCRNDGAGALVGVDTETRTVCNNTVRSALAADGDRAVRIRHTASAGERIEAFAKNLREGAGTFGKRIERFRDWTRVRMTRDQQTQYVAAVVPDGSASKEHVARVRATITRLADIGRGTDLPGVRGTLWGGFNAATEYVSQVRSAKRDADARMKSVLFGSGAEIIERAERLAGEYAAAA